MTYATERAPIDTFNAFAAVDHDSEQRHWMEAGYAALGYSQRTKRAADGLHTDYVWVLMSPEQVAGLPAQVVERARDAIAAEAQARATLQAKDEQAAADIGRMGLTGAAAEYHLQITRGEAWAAFQATQKPTRLALRDLGRLAERAAQIRAVRNAAPGKRAQVEAQAAQLLAQIEAELDAVELEAAQLGLS